VIKGFYDGWMSRNYPKGIALWRVSDTTSADQSLFMLMPVEFKATFEPLMAKFGAVPCDAPSPGVATYFLGDLNAIRSSPSR
jgi:hypothetical protein